MYQQIRERVRFDSVLTHTQSHLPTRVSYSLILYFVEISAALPRPGKTCSSKYWDFIETAPQKLKLKYR